MPTPAPVDAPSYTDILNAGLSIAQTFGIIPFIIFGAIIGAGAMLFKRFKSAAR
jgi:hypothetical protein